MPELKGMLVGLLLALMLLAFAGANWKLGKDNTFSIEASRTFSNASEWVFVSIGVLLTVLLSFDAVSEAASELKEAGPKIIPALMILASAAFLTLVVWFFLANPSEKSGPPREPACPDCNLIVIAVDGISPYQIGMYGRNSPTRKISSLDQLSRDSAVFERIYSPLHEGLFSEEYSILSGRFPEKPAIAGYQGGVILEESPPELKSPTLLSETVKGERALGIFTDRGIKSENLPYGIPINMSEVDYIGGEKPLELISGALEKLPPSKKFAFYARLSFPYTKWIWRSAAISPEFMNIQINTQTGKTYTRTYNENGFSLMEYPKGRADSGKIKKEYDSMISEIDSSLNGLISALRKKGLLEKTVIVVTAPFPSPIYTEPRAYDEDSRGEAEKLPAYTPFSSDGIYPRALNVPLIVYVPGSEQSRPERIGTLADIAPTILPILGLNSTPGPAFDGESLFSDRERAVVSFPVLCYYKATEADGATFLEYFRENALISSKDVLQTRGCCPDCDERTVEIDYITGAETLNRYPRTDLFSGFSVSVENGTFAVSRKA